MEIKMSHITDTHSDCLLKLSNKHLITAPLGNSEFCFPRIEMFPWTWSLETYRFKGNKIHRSAKDQSLSYLLQ